MYKFFINRPIVAMVIAILTVIIGLVSMASLPVAQFPSIVPPEIRIQTTYLGGDSQSLAQSVISAPCQKVIAASWSPFKTNGGRCAMGKPANGARAAASPGSSGKAVSLVWA